MSSRDGYPTRILVIAGAIFLALVALLWFLSGLGTPSQPVPGLEEEPALPPETPGLEEAGDVEPETIELAPGVTDDVATEPVTLQLFVIEAGSVKLVPRIRRLRAPTPLPAQAQIAIEELVRLNQEGELSPLPSETVVREVWVSPGGIAYVDFGDGFRELLPQGSLGELHAVYGVVATLTSSFPDIRAVQLLVDGEAVDTLTGHVDTAGPIGPWAGWVY